MNEGTNNLTSTIFSLIKGRFPPIALNALHVPMECADEKYHTLSQKVLDQT